jgi:chemotaxis methyl-accepting protein methylase
MLADDYFRRHGVALRYGVTGTDISLYSLATAKQAIYPDRRYAQIPQELQARYTERLPDGGFRMAEALRRRICFAQFNILHAGSTPPGSMDLVYCQNVLIYFDRETRAKILNGLVRPLREGGMLILGAGEMVGWEHPQLTRAGSMDVLAFQRVTL